MIVTSVTTKRGAEARIANVPPFTAAAGRHTMYNPTRMRTTLSSQWNNEASGSSPSPWSRHGGGLLSASFEGLSLYRNIAWAAAPSSAWHSSTPSHEQGGSARCAAERLNSHEQGLGFRVERLARGRLAADGHEARHLQRLARRLHRVRPLLSAAARVDFLGVRGGLLGDDLAGLVPRQRRLREARLGLLLLAREHGGPRELALRDLADLLRLHDPLHRLRPSLLHGRGLHGRGLHGCLLHGERHRCDAERQVDESSCERRGDSMEAGQLEPK